MKDSIINGIGTYIGNKIGKFILSIFALIAIFAMVSCQMNEQNNTNNTNNNKYYYNK